MDEKDIISTDFNYDVYSGGSAKKYLDEYNAQKKREREEAAKSDAEKRRDEYRKRFEGMSADELFDRPLTEKPTTEPQPAPEELLDDVAGIKNELPELTDLPTLEPMMEGEEEPDSLSPDQKLKTERYNEGVAAVDEMLASARYRRDYQSMVYGNRRSMGLGYPLGYSAFTTHSRDRLGYKRYRLGGRRFNSREERAAYIYFTCVMLGAFLAFSLQMPFGMYFLIGGAAGAVSSVIRRMVEHGHSLPEAIAASRLSIIVAGVGAVLGLLFSF